MKRLNRVLLTKVPEGSPLVWREITEHTQNEEARAFRSGKYAITETHVFIVPETHAENRRRPAQRRG